MRNEFWKYLLWAVVATVWSTLCFILPDFMDNPIHDLRTVCMIGVYLLVIGGASFWVLYLMGLNRYVAWVCLPVFAIVGAVISYYRVAFHATVTPMIIDATLHTNGGTIAGVISWQLVGWVCVNIVIAVALLLWRQRIDRTPKAWVQAIVVIGCMLLYYHANGRIQSSINQRYPYNIVHNWMEYRQQRQEIAQERMVLPSTPVCLPDSIDVVFVLGEAMRADHLQLNGYERETTPLLMGRKDIVSLPNIYSEYTYTATSVPHILSPADSLHPEWSGTYSSFIQVLKNYGFSSTWISNQDNGHTYASFIHEADTIVFPNASKSVFVYDPWYDEILLPPLDQRMTRRAARNIYVLHTIGSHWYYNLHVPEPYQVFTPLTTNRVITNNTDEQIINSYDNTALYADMLLDSIIQRLQDRCALMIYLSDHGEALGEDGAYLHAGDVEGLHRPACVIWYSASYAAAYPDKVAALHANKDKALRTDFLYYSLLSGVGIQAQGSNPAVDIFQTE